MVKDTNISKKGNIKVEKYLTEMKELSNDDPEDAEVSVVKEVKKNEEKQPMIETKDPKDEKAKPEESVEKINTEVAPRGSTVNEVSATLNEDLITNSDTRSFTYRDIILGIVNVISIVFLIILLIKLPDKATLLKQARNQNLKLNSSVAIDFATVSDSKTMADTLQAMFLDDSGVVNFVGQVENLKSADGTPAKVTFPSPKAIKDKTGNYGYPVIIELIGPMGQLKNQVSQIESLPFLLRPVNIEIDKTDKQDVEDLKYGGILYVAQGLVKN